MATTEENVFEGKYGREMANWLQERLIPSIVDCSSIIRATTKEFTRLKQARSFLLSTVKHYFKLDPLCNWYHQSAEVSAQVASRISRFTEQMTRRVKWSFLIEPGKFSCHLSEFLGEFHRLTLISQNELAMDEVAKSAFNANYLAKARSKSLSLWFPVCVVLSAIPCLDSSRVILADGVDNRLHRDQVIGAMFNTEEQHTDENGDEL